MQPNLRILDIGATRTLTDAGLAHLAGLKKLEQLTLKRAPNISSKGVAHLAKLPLKRLTIHSSHIDDTGIASLSRIKTLEYLNVGWSRKITDAGVAHLASLPKLHTLNASFAQGVTDGTLAKLAKLPLVHLDLTSSGCKKSGTAMKYTDEGLRMLAAVPTLKKVILWRAPHITRAGVAALRAGGRDVKYNGGD